MPLSEGMLSQVLIDELLTHATMISPEETCGLLFNAYRCWWTVNRSLKPCESFTISHDDFVSAKAMHNHASPWAIVHSHPGKSAAPSQPDCRLMDAFQTIGHPMDFVIVGLKPVEIRCFRKQGDLYHLEWLYVPQV